MNDNEEKPKAEKNVNSNIIFVGSKPLVNYVKAVSSQFLNHKSPEVIIKSRGKFISKAVDIIEIVKRNLKDKGVYIKEIKTESESFQINDRKTTISTMDITLALKQN